MNLLDIQQKPHSWRVAGATSLLQSWYGLAVISFAVTALHADRWEIPLIRIGLQVRKLGEHGHSLSFLPLLLL